MWTGLKIVVMRCSVCVFYDMHFVKVSFQSFRQRFIRKFFHSHGEFRHIWMFETMDYPKPWSIRDNISDPLIWVMEVQLYLSINCYVFYNLNLLVWNINEIFVNYVEQIKSIFETNGTKFVLFHFWWFFTCGEKIWRVFANVLRYYDNHWQPLIANINIILYMLVSLRKSKRMKLIVEGM